MTCVTDPYGNPYVPGSSLKGMLRTILLSKDIAQDQIKYKRDQSQIRSELSTGRKNRKILNRNIGIIEKRLFVH